jgi:anti-sigma factor RsiW
MIEHLSAEQISQWMVGGRPLELEQHVAECAECRAELGQLESALAQFRTAMREPANFVPPPAWRQPEPRPAAWFSWPRLVLTATALLVLVAVPVSWRLRNREQTLRAQAAQIALADSQLLESVDAEISQAVPQPMEPLVSLATWNSSSTEQNQKSQRQ